MEILNNLSPELQGMVLHQLFQTPAQVKAFRSLPPALQRKVATDAWTPDEVRGLKCRSPHVCGLSFTLWGIFHRPGSIEEYDRYRLHGMCSRCKEKTERRKARREARLRGRALLEQAWMDDDERGIEEHWHWHTVDSDYDYQSDSPDTREMMMEDEQRQRDIQQGNATVNTALAAPGHISCEVAARS